MPEGHFRQQFGAIFAATQIHPDALSVTAVWSIIVLSVTTVGVSAVQQSLLAKHPLVARKPFIFSAIVIFGSILRQRVADSHLTSLYPEGGDDWIPAMHSSVRAKLQSATAIRVALIARLSACAIVILASLSSGCCSTGYLTLRTLVCEPSKYCFKIDRIRSKSVYHRWAAEEWERAVQSSPDIPISAAYHAGFVDGFVDFVYLGGTGEPPPIPPRQFWNVEGRSLEGKAMANDWFAGFRHGSRMGAEGGYRVLATLHTSFGDSSDLPPGEPVSGPMNYGSAEPAVEPLPAPAAIQPANQLPTPPQTSSPTPTDSSEPLEPNDLPLDAASPNAGRAVPPAGSIAPPTELGDGAYTPPLPEVVNPFRTATAEPVAPLVKPIVETQPEQPASYHSEEFAPTPLALPPEGEATTKLVSHEPKENPAKTASELPLPALVVLPAVPMSESLAKPAKEQLSKTELLKLTALPVEQPAEMEATSENPVVAPKLDDRTVREKNRAAYFAK